MDFQFLVGNIVEDIDEVFGLAGLGYSDDEIVVLDAIGILAAEVSGEDGDDLDFGNGIEEESGNLGGIERGSASY